MTGISDLQTVFGAATQVEGDAGGVKAMDARGGPSEIDQPQPGADQSVVSSTGDAMVQAMGDSDVRTDKVASLQAAIASGSYQVSSSDVADKLIDSMLGNG